MRSSKPLYKLHISTQFLKALTSANDHKDAKGLFWVDTRLQEIGLQAEGQRRLAWLVEVGLQNVTEMRGDESEEG